MTASEFAFLALGLLLGVASGAALIEVLRSRPPAKREVRVTVAPNSIPRRATTLTESEVVDRGPARGGPADRRWVDRDLSAEDELPLTAAAVASTAAAIGLSPIDPDPYERTPVPSRPALTPFTLAPLAAAGGAVAKPPPRQPVGIAIESEPDPMVTALRVTAAAAASAAMRGPDDGGGGGGRSQESVAAVGAAVGASGAAPVATASADNKPTDGGVPGPAPGGGGGSASITGSTADAPDDICADQRRVADERCAVATRARDGAKSALESLRSNQRAYDYHVSRAETAAAAADPRLVRDAKETAQQAFRVARSAGGTRDDVETAARDWLTEINRINHATRDASASAEKHRKAAAEIALTLERLSVEADAARISAEAADEACVAAREAVAACQEAALIAAAGGPPAVPLDVVPLSAPAEDDAAATPMASRAGEDAAIIRLLRGDPDVMTRIVARLGGDDEVARRHWQGLLTEFLEALIARSIEASAFDFPLENSFWATFTRSQARDIMAALASLGYRHDGFGGWADDRVPSQRDLSLAVGYAGLDPMRIRRWPSETEMAELLHEVTVAADEFVWESAGGLTLGELVSLLGLRADGLAELWNEWGVIRPMLLSAE